LIASLRQRDTPVKSSDVPAKESAMFGCEDDAAPLYRNAVASLTEGSAAPAVTSPLQFLKSIRLHRARLLMVNAGHNASTAAAAAGYDSASQFDREFKRFSGATPAQDTAKLRGQLVV
jgi:hypothetical protein